MAGLTEEKRHDLSTDRLEKYAAALAELNAENPHRANMADALDKYTHLRQSNSGTPRKRAWWLNRCAHIMDIAQAWEDGTRWARHAAKRSAQKKIEERQDREREAAKLWRELGGDKRSRASKIAKRIACDPGTVRKYLRSLGLM